MDHIGFENEMIDCVNRNCENAEQARRKAFAEEEKKKLEAYIAEQEKRAYTQQRIKSNAAAWIIVWITVFLSAVLGLCYLSWLSIISPVVPVASCAVVGLVTGLRVNALARAFRK